MFKSIPIDITRYPLSITNMSNNRFATLSNLTGNLDGKIFVPIKPKKQDYRNRPKYQAKVTPPKDIPKDKTAPNVTIPENPNFTAVNNYRNKKPVDKKPIAKKIPKPVLSQRELRQIHKYAYRVVNNGNVENNTTIYVTTMVAHPHQVEAQFKDAIGRAKKMPEVFGEDFECTFQVNVVRRYTGEYMGYAFVDVTNPKFYFAMIGCNVDGSDRAEYIEDPNWVPPKIVPKAPRDPSKPISWADDDEDDDRQLHPPKIRKELPPLITLGEYEYDEQQKSHLQTDETYGTLSVSPAFITPGVGQDYDDCSLYVSEVPAVDYDFLYELFSRYARTNSHRENDRFYYPRINIRKCIVKETKECEGENDGEEDKDKKNENKTGIFAIVQYSHPYDSAFALCMLQKVRARYNNKDIAMPVRYAFANR